MKNKSQIHRERWSHIIVWCPCVFLIIETKHCWRGTNIHLQPVLVQTQRNRWQRQIFFFTRISTFINSQFTSRFCSAFVHGSISFVWRQINHEPGKKKVFFSFNDWELYRAKVKWVSGWICEEGNWDENGMGGENMRLFFVFFSFFPLRFFFLFCFY